MERESMVERTKTKDTYRGSVERLAECNAFNFLLHGGISGDTHAQCC